MKNQIVTFFKGLKKRTWKKIEYFDESWKDRIMQMTKYISPNSKVIDLGCGKMWTREFLPKGCTYIGADYVKRGEDTIICDFNRYQFPNIITDVAFISGCLEYINDYVWFINQVSKYSTSCIISYCTLESFPKIELRKELAWVNNLKREELITLFEKTDFKLFKEDITSSNNSIFVFSKI